MKNILCDKCPLAQQLIDIASGRSKGKLSVDSACCDEEMPRMCTK